MYNSKFSNLFSIALTVFVSGVLSSDPASLSGTNTTQPLSRAQVMAMTPEEADSAMLSTDPGFASCKDGDYGSDACQNAQTSALAKMTQTQQDVSSDLTNVAVQLNAIQSQQADGNAKISKINNAIYGNGNSDNIGLIQSLQKVALSLQDIQNTVRTQATDIANKSSTVRSSTELKVQAVKTVMDAKLADVEKKINDLVNAQALGQQQMLVNSAINMQKAAAGAQLSIATNTNTIKAGVKALSDAGDDLLISTQTNLNQLSSGIEENVHAIQTIADTGTETLQALKDTLTTDGTQAIAQALATGQQTIASTATSASKSLNDARADMTSQITDAGGALKNEIAQTQADLNAGLVNTQAAMHQTERDNAAKITELSTTASEGVVALAKGQDASGAQMIQQAQTVQAQLGTTSDAISQYAKTGEDSQKYLQSLVGSLVAPMQQSASQKLTDQSQASGTELTNMNANIAKVLSGINGMSGDALAALSQYLSDVQAQAGQDSKGQDQALSDSQQAIMYGKQLSEAKLGLQSDRANQALSQLMAVLGSSLQETAGTVNDVNAANAAKQNAIQGQTQQQILDAKADMVKKVNAAKIEQQTSLNGLQSDQAQKAQQLNALITTLMGVFDQLDVASKASQGDLSNLNSLIATTQSSSNSDVENLFQLLETSKSAASAGASGASAQIQLLLGKMGDQLGASIKNYAGQFNGDFADAIKALSSTSNDTSAKLAASGLAQQAAATDAESQTKNLQTDLSQLGISGQSQIDALVSLFRSKALQAGLDRQVKLKGITDGASGQLDDLRGKITDMINSQSSALAASTSQTVSNQQSQLATLVETLRSQQIGATRLATQTQGALANVEKWTGDLSAQIASAEKKVGTSKDVQMGVIQGLQGELNEWSNAVDRNISDARQELQDGMAMIPNVTASKAADTERIFAASNENMRTYLNNLKAAFDKMRTTESQYVQQQSLRRLSTLMGIDRSSLDNSNVLMQLLGVSDLSQLGDEKQIATVLAGLADGVSSLQAKNGDAFNALRSQITHLDANSKGLFGQLLNQAGGSLGAIYQKYAADQHALQATIEAAADKDNVRAQALDDALSGMLGSVRSGSLVLNTQLANDRKNIYAVDGAVRQLGDESAIALSRLLHSAQAQSTAADSALAASQRVNADRVASVRDVVIAFVRAMEEYVDGSRVGFDDIHTKLDKYKDFLDSKLGISDTYMLEMAQSTQSELTATTDLAQALENRIEAFNARAKQQLFNVEQERSAIEARHEDELNQLRSKLSDVGSKVADDQALVAKQVDDWLSEEDADLGFGAVEPAVTGSPQSVTQPTKLPDWAQDASSSFVEKRRIRRHIAA